MKDELEDQVSFPEASEEGGRGGGAARRQGCRASIEICKRTHAISSLPYVEG